MKLFQMIQDNQPLEGWVQAKITKAADYLDSIYHYMEYQVKFGQGAVAASVDDITGDMETAARAAEEDDEKTDMEESMNYEQKLQALLESAVKKAKKDYDGDGKIETNKDEVWGSRAKAAAKSGKPFKEGFPTVDDAKKNAQGTAGMKPGEKKKSSTGGTIEKTKTGIKHTAGKNYSGKGVAEKDGRLKEADGKCNHTPKGEKCPVHGLKECGTMMAYEAAKPSAGMSKGAKSALVKKAKAGGDVGKPGKSFDKVAKAAGGQKNQDSAIKVAQISKSKSPGATLTHGAEDALEKGNHKKIDQIHQYATTTTPTGRAKKVSEAKPSAGLSAAKKSAVVKDAKAGGDIGKPGKSFDKVAKSAGGGEKGKKIAAAAMWKNAAK
jgi:hypothetical protein